MEKDALPGESEIGADFQSNFGDVRVTERQGSSECFPISFFVFTVGVIPSHCETIYDVSVPATNTPNQSIRQAQYEVTSMMGWFIYFMPIFPKWHFGLGNDVEPEIRKMVADDLQ
jgi:hypothetical protein